LNMIPLWIMNKMKMKLWSQPLLHHYIKNELKKLLLFLCLSLIIHFYWLHTGVAIP
jgi:hypothetical protein